MPCVFLYLEFKAIRYTYKPCVISFYIVHLCYLRCTMPEKVTCLSWCEALYPTVRLLDTIHKIGCECVSESFVLHTKAVLTLAQRLFLYPFSFIPYHAYILKHKHYILLVYTFSAGF